MVQCSVDVHPVPPVVDEELGDEVPALDAELGPPELVVPLPLALADLGEGLTVIRA